MSPTNFFHQGLCKKGQKPLHVHNPCIRPDPSAPSNPTHNHFGAFALAFPRWRSSAWSEMHLACVGELFTLSSSGSNLWAICCYLENVLHTLHGHICTSALTSLLFLTPARCWRLLWWCHTGLPNKSDCLSWVTLPACFSCCVCLCLFICHTGFFVMTCFAGLTSSALVCGGVKVQQSELHLFVEVCTDFFVKHCPVKWCFFI